MTHDQIIDAVIWKLKDASAWYMVIPDSRKIRGWGGWPDITIMSPTRIMFREIKTTGDIMRPMQLWVCNRLRQSGLDWDIWTEHDLESGRVDAELATLRQ